MLFLEVCMSLFINIAYRESVGASTAAYLASIAICALLFFLLSFLMVLLFCGCGLGPQTAHLYKRFTILRSIWEPRPLRDQASLIKLVKEDKELHEKAML